jgi:DDE superfamily endonuclease
MGSVTRRGLCAGLLVPYSPELNPIERVWKLTRRQCLHNRHFPVLEEVVAVVEAQFENWRNGNKPYTVYAQSLKTLRLDACTLRPDVMLPLCTELNPTPRRWGDGPAHASTCFGGEQCPK